MTLDLADSELLLSQAILKESRHTGSGPSAVTIQVYWGIFPAADSSADASTRTTDPTPTFRIERGDDMSIFSHFQQRFEATRQEEYSLQEYLDLCKQDPSAYATAAALVSQGSPIVPLQIRGFLTGEVVLGQENLGKALGLGMVIVVSIAMGVNVLLQRRVAKWVR